MCVCVCVCVRQSKREERVRARGDKMPTSIRIRISERTPYFQIHNVDVIV